VSAAALGAAATVRAWRAGDRIRPLGLGGTKTLQDLFTDRKIPRSLRHTLPVVEVGGQVAWVAGVALDERFAVRPCEPSVGLSARLVRG
jgi:tRNA(Ile)-lysidine synthase